MGRIAQSLAGKGLLEPDDSCDVARLTLFDLIALVRVHLQESADGFAEKYLDMLKAGGTKRHKELLAPFGLDASDPGFWARGLAVIEGLIGELEAME